MKNNEFMMAPEFGKQTLRILYGVKGLELNPCPSHEADCLHFLQSQPIGTFIRNLHVFLQTRIMIAPELPIMESEKKYFQNLGIVKIPKAGKQKSATEKGWIAQMVSQYQPQLFFLLDEKLNNELWKGQAHHQWKNWHEENIRDIYSCEGSSTKIIRTASPLQLPLLGIPTNEMIEYLAETANKILTIMAKINFKPFVGVNYENGLWGHKTLVLGESHYGDGAEEPNVTNEVINYFLDADSEHEGWMNTYTKFGKAMACDDISKDEQRQVWNQVVFYNYIQHFLPECRQAPTPQEFRDSLDAFLEVLDQYQPEVVIVWGERMFRNLPSIGKALPSFTSSTGDTLEIWGYPLKNGKIVPLLPVYHPSAGFSWDKWGIIMKEFIQNL